MGAPAVICVVSTARAGSTVVGLTLAAQRDWFAAGELELLWARAAERRRPCGCGRLVAECPVWSAVIEQANPSDSMHSVYSAVALAAESRVIVDTSKSIRHVRDAMESHAPVGVVHLVRDPRAVAYSSLRRPLRGGRRPFGAGAAARIAAHWMLLNARVELLTRLGRRSWALRLRYEDFVHEPDASRRAVGRLVGFATDPFDAAGYESRENHVVSGNPARRQDGPLKLKLDDAWIDVLPRRYALMITIIALPMLLAYRYPLMQRRRPR